MIKKIINLLNTGTIKDSLVSFSGQLTASILGAIFFAIIFRSLGKTDFGIFSLAYATAIILKDLLDPAVNAALLRFIPGTTKEKGYAYSKYLAEIKLGYFLLLIPPFLIFNQLISFLIFKRTFLALIPLILLTSFILSIATYLSGLYRARKMFFSEALYASGQTAIRLILILVILYANLISVQTVLVVNFTAYVFMIAIAIYQLRPTFLLAPVSKEVRSSVNSFLPAMVLSSTTGTITDRVNLYLTNYFVDLASVGLLSAVTQVFKPVFQFAGALDSVLGSRFSGFETDEQAKKYLVKALAISTFLSAGILFSNLIIRPIGVLIFGPEFLDGIGLYRIFTLAYSLFLFQPPFIAFALYYKGRSDIIAKISIIQFITTFIANLVFISWLGLIGTAWAMVVVFGISLLSTIVLSLHAKKKKI